MIPKRKWLMIMFLAIVAISFPNISCGKVERQPSGPALQTPAPNKSTGALAASAASGTEYSDIAEAAVQSVVNISAVKIVKLQESPFSPFFNDPFFRHFFGNPESRVPREQRENALGSGVIVTKDGYILTNNHVVENAAELKVITNDGKEMKAKIIGADPKSDVAVVKVDDNNLTPLALGDSDKLRLGEVVLAIGNPFGLSNTVTMGIVSAKGRANMGIVDYEDFIQTDAAINPGNSGGALINTRGELVGINTAIFSRSGGYQGVGFAIPINMARSVMDSLIKYGKVERGYLGVVIQDVRPEMMETFGLKTTGGALISDVVKGGPAAGAGFKRGDIVLAFNGKDITDAAMLRNLVSQSTIGKEADVVVLRDKNKITLRVKVEKSPNEPAGKEGNPEDNEQPEASSAFLGMTVANLTSRVLQRFNLPPNTKGVLIVQIQDGSAAEEAGLQPGDVIMEINRISINNVDDFKKEVKAAKSHNVLLLINRQGSTIFVMLRAK